jgi:hypothetical protein
VAHHGASARHDRAAERQIGEGAQCSSNARCNEDTREEASEQPIRITDELTTKGWKRRVCCCTNRIGTSNKECPLLVIKQACATLINDKASRQGTEGSEDSGAPLFTKFDTGEQASTTDRMRRLGECALLQGCSTRFKCGESTGE